MKFFQRQTKPLIGLDMNSQSVKAMVVARQADALHVTGFAQATIKQAQAKIHPTDALKQAIQTLLERLPTRSRRVAIAIPDRLTITRTLSVPQQLTEDEIESLVRLKAAEYLACVGKELYLDFERLPTRHHDKETLIKMIGVRKKFVDDKLSLITSLKLDPVIVDLQSACLLRAIRAIKPLSNKNTTSVIIDINTQSASLFYIHQDAIRHYEQLAIEAVERSPLTLLRQITTALTRFQTNHSLVHLKHLHLCGEIESLAELADAINNHTDYQTTVIAPSTRLRFDHDEPINTWPAQLSAFGLALRGLPPCR